MSHGKEYQKLVNTMTVSSQVKFYSNKLIEIHWRLPSDTQLPLLNALRRSLPRTLSMCTTTSTLPENHMLGTTFPPSQAGFTKET